MLIDILFVDGTVTIAIGLYIFQAMNAERYAEEVAQGLHSKGAKGSRAGKATAASGSASATGKRRGRPAKAAKAFDTEQIGLGF